MTESLSARLRTGADERLARGVVAGLAAGLLFLLANMWYADSQGLPAVAPLYDISTIFHFADKPQPSPENLAVGLVVHLTLSAAFGATFALLAPLVGGSARLVAAGAIFGLALYVLNFQILGRLLFEWFQKAPTRRSRSSPTSATGSCSPHSPSDARAPGRPAPRPDAA